MNHEQTDSVICPYCEEEQDLGRYFEDGEDNCDKCGKEFIVEVFTTVSYTTKKPRCREEHQWGKPVDDFFGGGTRTCEKCDLYESVEHIPEGVKI